MTSVSNYRLGDKSALMTKEYLMQEYVNNEQSLNQIARKIGCSKKLVLINIKKHKVSTRSNSLAMHIRSRRNFKLDGKVKNYVDGLILGDGHIFQRSQYSARYDQSITTKCREWADRIKLDFSDFGIDTALLDYMSSPMVIKKTGQVISSFPQVLLFTKFYEEFAFFKERWYPNGGTKTIPDDIEMAPITIANWYMGDGNFENTTGRIEIAINSFSPNDIQIVQTKMFKTLGIQPKIYPRRNQNNQPRMKFNRIDASKILKYTQDYKIPCFDYKWGIN